MKSRFLKLYRAYSTRSIRQMLAKLSGVEFKKTVSKFRKRKRKSLSCVHVTYISAKTYLLLPYSQNKTVSTIQIIQQGEPISRLFTLKKVLKTYELENANSTMAKNVLKPPFHTAGPISRKVARARSKKENIVSHQKGTLQHIFHLCTHPRRPRGSQSGQEKRRDESSFARTWKLSSRPFSRLNWLSLGLRGWCTGHLSHSYFKRGFSLTSTPYGIGHFRVPKPLTFKTRPSWKPFLWKWVSFVGESMALHLASLWNRG